MKRWVWFGLASEEGEGKGVYILRGRRKEGKKNER